MLTICEHGGIVSSGTSLLQEFVYLWQKGLEITDFIAFTCMILYQSMVRIFCKRNRVQCNVLPSVASLKKFTDFVYRFFSLFVFLY